MDDRYDVQDLNIELARRISDELLRDPDSPYAGKWIGIANGQVVIVGDSYDDVRRRLGEVEPDPFRCHCMEGVGIPEEEQNAIYGA